MKLHWMLNRYLSPEPDVPEGGSGNSFLEEASPAVAPVDTPSEDDSINWSSMADSLDADDEDEGDLVVEEAPVEQPVETPPATTPAETPPAAAPATEPAPSATPVVPEELKQSEPPPTTSPTEYATWRSTKMTQLEAEYALDEASAQALLTEPELVLPKLAAKVHMEVLEHSMQAMQAMMPVMMQQLQKHTEVESRARNLFTSINPDLADPRYETAIMQFGQVYRKVNPTAPADEASRAIGNLVRAALGVAAPQSQVGSPPPAVVQAPVQPFTPARGAGGGSAPSFPSNPFELLASEFLQEDN